MTEEKKTTTNIYEAKVLRAVRMFGTIEIPGASEEEVRQELEQFFAANGETHSEILGIDCIARDVEIKDMDDEDNPELGEEDNIIHFPTTTKH